jgi:phosphatidylglycerol:prolipoprotein diacylglycerol transferase
MASRVSARGTAGLSTWLASYGVAFPKGLPPTDIPVHPTQLYESLTGLALLLLVMAVRRRRHFAAGGASSSHAR